MILDRRAFHKLAALSSDLFAYARRWQVLAVNQNDLSHRSILAPQKTMVREMRVENTSIRNLDGFEKSYTDPPNDGPDVLVANPSRLMMEWTCHSCV